MMKGFAMVLTVPRIWFFRIAVAVTITLLFSALALILYNRTEQWVVSKHKSDLQIGASVASHAVAKRVDACLPKAQAFSEVLLVIHRALALSGGSHEKEAA
jgi:hypothetical protein